MEKKTQPFRPLLLIKSSDHMSTRWVKGFIFRFHRYVQSIILSYRDCGLCFVFDLPKKLFLKIIRRLIKIIKGLIGYKNTVRYTPVQGSKLELGIMIPKGHRVINVELFGVQKRDVLLHLDFRYKKNVLSINNREAYLWKKEKKLKYEYLSGKKHDVTLIFEETAIHILLKHERNVLEVTQKDIPVHDINYLVYTEGSVTCPGFTLGNQGLARLAPYAAWSENCSGTFRQAYENTSKKQGLSCVFFAFETIKGLKQFITEIYAEFDEILIILSSQTMAKVGEIRILQSRYFNLKYYINDGKFGEVENRSFTSVEFYNEALGKVRFTNVFFWQSSFPLHPKKIKALISSYQLSTRQDIFSIWFKGGANKVGRLGLLAMSQREPICFEESRDGCKATPALNKIFYNKSNMEITDVFEENPMLDFEACSPELCSISMGHLQTSQLAARLNYPLQLETYHTNQVLTAKPSTKLLIAVICCEKNRDRIKALRETWIPLAYRANIACYFVIGRPHHPSRVEQDILYVDAPDTYEYLGMKVQRLMQFVEHQTDFDYVFKIDDDCLLNIHHLLRINYEDYDYLGTAINRGAGAVTDWHYDACDNKQLANIHILLESDVTWYDGQGGYFISRKAIGFINENKQKLRSSLLEDYGVGSILKQYGIIADYVIPQFQSRRIDHIKPRQYARFSLLSDISSAEEMIKTWEVLKADGEYFDLPREFADTFSVRQ